jgi:hypothetical protein
MNCRAKWSLCLLVWAFLAVPPGVAQNNKRLSYTLLEGSYFIDDCLVCGRPTIMQPLHGTFELVLVQDTPPYTRYAVENVDLVASPGSSLERHLTGSGTYVRFEEFARLQDMDLALWVKDSYTNRLAFFTNDNRVAQAQFPLIEASLSQTNGTLFQTFSIQLSAAPVREIWFSTSKAFISTNRFGPTNQISAGDLLSNRGRVIKRNIDLVGRLGVMPIVPDLGLDAVDVAPRAEILFSIPVKVFSETLGYIQHGDLLSSRGVIVRKNQELLGAFHPLSSTDAGLDAVQLMPDGEILFSIQSNLVVSTTLTLSRGDILSDRGRIFMTHQQLLANFRPAITNRDFGLDALHVFPGGEVWFSVEEGFTDNRLGPVQPGDLLSSLGRRVFSNRDLLGAFAPADPSLDYGLDGLFVVTDDLPHAQPPRIVNQTRSNGMMHVGWDGQGQVFQLEHASSLFGPWLPCSPIVPELSWDTPCDLAGSTARFYRVRQW